MLSLLPRLLVTLAVLASLLVASLWPGGAGPAGSVAYAGASASAAPLGRAQAQQPLAGATLSVLAPPVDVAPGGSGSFSAAQDGQTVQPSDRVRTGPGGVALLTFFDGSETQLTPDTELALGTPASGQAASTALVQALGTTVNRVQQLAAGETFQTDTPAAVALVRGTLYTLTVKEVPVAAATGTPLLTFPRVLATSTDLLAAQTVYTDGASLWEVRSWRDTATGANWDTFRRVGEVYPQVGEALYVEADGSLWRARTFADPATGETWQTYEDLGQPAAEPAAGGLQRAASVSAAPLRQTRSPITAGVLLEGRLDLLPRSGPLPSFTLAPGEAGGVLRGSSALATLTTAGFQAFQGATADLRDVPSALLVSQLASQVADELAAVLQSPGGGGQAGGAPGSGGPPPGDPTGGAGGGLLESVAMRVIDAGDATAGAGDTGGSGTAGDAGPGGVAGGGSAFSRPVGQPGTSAAVRLSPTILTFGTGGGQQQLTVANASGSFVALPPLSLRGGDGFSLTNGCPLPPDLLAPWASCTITVSAQAGSPRAAWLAGGWPTEVLLAVTRPVSLQPLPTPTATRTPTPSPTPTSTPVPEPENPPAPTATPTSTPEPAATATATATPTVVAAATSTATSTATLSPTPSSTPTPSPSATATATPTISPCAVDVPTNDDFACALLVTVPGAMNGTTSGATVEPGEPTWPGNSSRGAYNECFIVPSHEYRATVWFKLTPSQAGQLVASTANPGTNFDTALALYTGSSLSTLQKVACDNNGDGETPPGSSPQWSSILRANVQAGQTYYLQLAGIGGAIQGEYTLTLAMAQPPTATPTATATPTSTGQMVLDDFEEGGPEIRQGRRLWTANATAAATPSSTSTYSSVVEEGGLLRMNVTCPNRCGFYDAGSASLDGAGYFGISGDFDVQVDYSAFDARSDALDDARASLTVRLPNVERFDEYQLSRARTTRFADGGPPQDLYVVTVSDAPASGCAPAPTTDTSGQLRIARTGSTLAFSYRRPETVAWVPLCTVTVTTATGMLALDLRLVDAVEGPPSAPSVANVQFDNVMLNQGRMSGTGFSGEGFAVERRSPALAAPPSATSTPTLSPVPSPTPALTPTQATPSTPTPMATPTAAVSPTPTAPAATVTATPTPPAAPTPAPAPSLVPTATTAVSDTPTATPVATAGATAIPTLTAGPRA